MKRLPRHVAIIMDGNGRWAKERKLPRIMGHRAGMKSVRAVVSKAAELKIEHLTLYAFSVENWRRPEKEIRFLMNLLAEYLDRELKTMLSNNVRLNHIGRLDGVPERITRKFNNVIEQTRNNDGLTLSLAIGYGARAELVEAFRHIARQIKTGAIEPDDIDEETISGALYTKNIPDPDLMIRTSGELRLSNFLLWQISYAELYITDVNWPDFGENKFIEALIDYQKRERRFGLTSVQLNHNNP